MKTIQIARLAAAALVASLALSAQGAQSLQADDQIAVGQAAIINALAAGADRHAPAILKRARMQIAAARELLARKDYAAALKAAYEVEKEALVAETQALEAKAGRALAAISR
ncbi:MAG TPA: DUF4398 domain-containing protein [Usitatibacter sp.]|nr:DUF4398 domain-containing protein [Usitatibacter sp.]